MYPPMSPISMSIYVLNSGAAPGVISTVSDPVLIYIVSPSTTVPVDPSSVYVPVELGLLNLCTPLVGYVAFVPIRMTTVSPAFNPGPVLSRPTHMLLYEVMLCVTSYTPTGGFPGDAAASVF